MELEGPIADREGLRSVVDEALDEAINDGLKVYSEAVTQNLQRHRSSATGTGQHRTEQQARWAENRIELADGARIDEETKEVYLHSDVEWLGNFLEYGGFERYYWGRPSGEIASPNPFMRPAFQEKTPRAIDAIAKALAKELE